LGQALSALSRWDKLAGTLGEPRHAEHIKPPASPLFYLPNSTTHYLEVVAGQPVEVRVLSTAPANEIRRLVWCLGLVFMLTKPFGVVPLGQDTAICAVFLVRFCLDKRYFW
jgi:hypothetical protein